MIQPNVRFERGPTPKETLARWRDRVVDRMRAHNPDRRVWDRDLFLKQFAADHPFNSRGVEFADMFEDAIDASRGNRAEFVRQLNDRLNASEPAGRVSRTTS